MRQCCGKPSSEKKLELEKAATCFSAVGMHAEACEALQERASLSPENPLIWNDLGVQRVAAGQPADALIAFKRALEAFPEYPAALYNLGKLAFDECLAEQCIRGRRRQDAQIHALATEAIKYLQASIAVDPSLACAHELLYRAFEVLGDPQKAGSHLSQALALHPELQTLYDRPRLGRLPLIGRIFSKSDYAGPDFLSS